MWKQRGRRRSLTPWMAVMALPDPQPGGGIVAEVGEAADPESPEFRGAEKECRKHTEAMDKKLGVTRSEG